MDFASEFCAILARAKLELRYNAEPMLFCSGCGTAVDADAAYCSKCGRAQSQPVSVAAAQMPVYVAYRPATIPARSGPRSYIWGWIHGTLLVSFGIAFLIRFHTFIWRADALLITILGICILRRNRLILPLLFLHLAIGFLFVITRGLIDPSTLRGVGLPLGLSIVYGVYYFNRRNEFTTWF